MVKTAESQKTKAKIIINPEITDMIRLFSTTPVEGRVFVFVGIVVVATAGVFSVN